MSEYLTKDFSLFERDEKGELLPVEIDITLTNNETKKIKVLPISRGKWLRIIKLSDEEQDKIILKEHVIEPSFTDEDYTKIKPIVMSAISTAIVSVSLGISIDKSTDRRKLTEAEEYDLKKN